MRSAMGRGGFHVGMVEICIKGLFPLPSLKTNTFLHLEIDAWKFNIM